MGRPTAEQLAVRRRLHAIGEKIRSAQTQNMLQDAMNEARVEGLQAIVAHNTPEPIVAYALGLDRMTVQSWQDKP